MGFFWIFLFAFSFFLIPITTLPLVPVFLILLFVFYEKPWVFVLAFFAGILLDLSLFRPLGQTSVAFALFLLIISLYGKKFEVKTVPFVFFSSFLGSLIYLRFFGYQMVLFQSLISSILAVLLFRLKFLW